MSREKERKGIPSGENVMQKGEGEPGLPDTQGWAFLPLRVTTGKGRCYKELVP